MRCSFVFRPCRFFASFATHLLSSWIIGICLSMVYLLFALSVLSHRRCVIQCLSVFVLANYCLCQSWNLTNLRSKGGEFPLAPSRWVRYSLKKVALTHLIHFLLADLIIYYEFGLLNYIAWYWNLLLVQICRVLSEFLSHHLVCKYLVCYRRRRILCSGFGYTQP